MKLQTTSVNTRAALKVVGWTFCLGALPLFCGVTGCGTSRGCPEGEHTTLDEITTRWANTSGYPDWGTPESRADRATTSRVRSALAANPEYKFANVQVVTLNGVPYLSGVVASEDQRHRAGDIALHVEGVLAVANLITVTN